MRGQSTPHCSRRRPYRIPSEERCSTGSAIGRYWRGVEAKRSTVASGDSPRRWLIRHLPFDRRPRRSHPGGRSPAAVRGPASAPGSSSKAPRPGRLMYCKRRWSADELTSPGAPGLASLVLTHPGCTAAEVTSGNRRSHARAKVWHALPSTAADRHGRHPARPAGPARTGGRRLLTWYAARGPPCWSLKENLTPPQVSAIAGDE
mgnify:CR=1 FL=1